MDTPSAIKLLRVRRACENATRRNVKLDPRTIIDLIDGKKQ